MLNYQELNPVSPKNLLRYKKLQNRDNITFQKLLLMCIFMIFDCKIKSIM